MKNNKGITLIVLVITISIMITLAAIGVSYIVGEDGIIGKAEEISKEQEEENEKEENEMVISGLEMAVSSVNLEGMNIEGLQQHLGDKYQVLDDIEDENKFLVWDKNNEKTLYINKNIEGEVEEAKDIKIIDSSKNGLDLETEKIKDGFEFAWKEKKESKEVTNLMYIDATDVGSVRFPDYIKYGDELWGILTIKQHKEYKFSEVVLPKKIKTTAPTSNTFLNCTNLQKVIIGYIENGICTNMFTGCINLKDVIFKSSRNTKILAYAFKGCTSLEEIILSENIESIMVGVFMNCKNLKIVYIGEKITTLAPTAFVGCTGIEKIQINKTSNKIKEEIGSAATLIKTYSTTKGKIYNKYGELVTY